MLKEFREFAVRGNVIDMAVGVLIGGAFGKIITSFVTDILMPPIGAFIGQADFKNLYVVLKGPKKNFASLVEAQQAGAITWNYGLFVNAIIDFVIVAFCLFLVVRGINRLRKSEEVENIKSCQFCFTDIPKEAVRCPHCTSQLM